MEGYRLAPNSLRLQWGTTIRPQTFLGKKITFLFSGETATEVHVDSIVDVGNIRIKRLDTGSSVLLVKKTLGNTTYWQGYQLLFTQSDVGKTGSVTKSVSEGSLV